MATLFATGATGFVGTALMSHISRRPDLLAIGLGRRSPVRTPAPGQWIQGARLRLLGVDWGGAA
jgi:hypothetical protein